MAWAAVDDTNLGLCVLLFQADDMNLGLVVVVLLSQVGDTNLGLCVVLGLCVLAKSMSGIGVCVCMLVTHSDS